MRVLQVNDLVKGGAGAETYMLALTHRLREAGHEVELFGASEPLCRSTSPRTWRSPTDAARLLDVIRRFRPLAIHAHNVAFMSPSPLLAARDEGVRVIDTIHDFRHLLDQSVPGEPVARGPAAVLRRGANHAKIRYVRKLLGAACHAFTAPSRALVERSREWAGETPVHHLPYPVELGPEPEPAADEPVFLFLGRLIEDKGLMTLRKAAESLPEGARVLLAGDGPMAEQLAGEPAFEMLGRVPRERVPALLDASLALVQPSEWLENYPLAVLEARERARAVIATTVGGLPEMVVEGVDGLLVPPFDPAALGQAMRTLCASPATARAMGLAGRQKVARENDPARHDELILSLYSGRDWTPAEPCSGD